MNKLYLLMVLVCMAMIADAQNNTTDEGVIINGVKWATRNVDAPGTFVEKPEDFGMFYQWNSPVGWSVTNPLISSDGISTWNSSWNGNNVIKWETTNNVCPTGWRIPSVDEIKSLMQAPYEVSSVNNISGYQFGSGTNIIFLPSTGFRYSDGDGTLYRNSFTYWSSTAERAGFAYSLYKSGDRLWWQDASSFAGSQSVRCVKEENSSAGIGVVEMDKIFIYPNPTTDVVYIKTTSDIVSDIKLYNPQGEQLLQTQSNEVDLSPYNKGMYLLQVDGQMVKVVKK